MKDCVVISIQNDFRVIGLRVKAGGKGKCFVEKCFAGTYLENDGPGEVLQLALESLDSKKCDRVVVCGGIEGSGVFEIRMPELSHEELKQAIAYELAKYVPLPVSDFVWSARIVPGEDGDEHSCRVRVVFMLRDKWEKFISELQIRGIKIDAYIDP